MVNNTQNKNMKIVTALGSLIMLASSPLSQGAVIISSTTGNGGFVNATANVNTTSITGWTATTNFWVDSGNTSLSTTPFGSDTTTNSRFIQLHNDSGCVLTSTSLFTVGTGDTINLSFDLKSGGSGPETTLTISIVDTVNATTLYTFGTVFNTGTTSTAFSQKDLTSGALAGGGSNLALRFTLSDPAATGRDFHLDRVYMEAVPEPSACLLGGLGMFGLMRRRRA